MSQDTDRVTSVYHSTSVTAPAALTDFQWPPSPAVWPPQSPLGPFESEITDVKSVSSRPGLLDDVASSVEPVHAEDTPHFNVNRATPYPLEPLTPTPLRHSRHSRRVALHTPALNTQRRTFHIGPAWVTALGLLALVQSAFILKTQFTPAGLPMREPISPLSVLAPVVQPPSETKKMLAPAVGTSASLPIQSTAAARGSGRLLVRSDPAGAKVLVDGRSHGVTPVNIADVAPGPRRVVVSFAGREVQQMVHVEAGSTASIIVPLPSVTERNVYGRIVVTAPFEVDIFESDALVGTSRMPELMLLPGPHTLRFVNEAFGYEHTRNVVVEAAKRVSVSVPVPQGELNVNALPWAEVSLDGDMIGETPLGNLTVAVGPHVVTFRHPELGENTIPVAVKVGVPARVAVDMRK